MGLGSYFELIAAFTEVSLLGSSASWQMRLAFRIFGYIANPAQDFLFHLSSLLCASPHRLYGDASEGLFISVRVIEVERLISAVSTPVTTRSLETHHEHNN